MSLEEDQLDHYTKMVIEASIQACKDAAFLLGQPIDKVKVDVDKIAESCQKKLSKETPANEVRVSDVIYPKDSVFDLLKNESYTDYATRTDKELDKLLAVSNNLPDGEVVGSVLTFPFADGSAMYKVNQRNPLVLEHIPYGDAYHASQVTLSGITLEYIEQQAAFNRGRATKLKI